MNKDQVGGAGKQLRGKLKDAIGGATGDRGLKADGKIDKGVGKVQKKLGDIGERSRRPKNPDRTP